MASLVLVHNVVAQVVDNAVVAVSASLEHTAVAEVAPAPPAPALSQQFFA